MADVAFQGEVQFRRWSDSSTQGVQVTFALPDSDALEPLKHKAGKRFMAVLVEIGDDEQPVPQPQRKDVRGPLCKEACDYCELPEFWKFCQLSGFPEVQSAQSAKDWMLDTLVIDSRKEIDTDAKAAEEFKRWVRIPFMRWQQSNRGA